MASMRIPMLLFFLTFNFLAFHSQARYHYHKKRKHSPPISQISQPPSGAPAPGPSYQPPKVEPIINTGVFDVRKFGAVGDGMTDDTDAFKTAWDAACQFESGVILVPNGYSFMIQSTIFTGPCKGGLVFQVDIVFSFGH